MDTPEVAESTGVEGFVRAILATSLDEATNHDAAIWSTVAFGEFRFVSRRLSRPDSILQDRRPGALPSPWPS